MAHIIDFTELEVTLLDAINNVASFYIDAKEVFELLMITGCRPLEIMQIERWHDSVGTNVTLDAAKGNQIRIISKAILPAYFKSAITNQVNPFPSLSYVRFRYAFLHTYAYPLARIGNKQVALYLFRHYQFKKLHNLGQTDAQIKSYMGENSLAVTMGYIYGDVWSE